jgi:hypothetical protein
MHKEVKEDEMNFSVSLFCVTLLIG